ncbi:hypothetical protein EVAR_48464_1 [Eumeta japonica]|uniref:Uncharacterized protein n=1 Tax=Eumeta variegata TaxID=151549 RepID=A0A4C1XEE2_EUMVA|nr:hypothetical protein EVAR_48464_1 [Eumeta japonica]
MEADLKTHSHQNHRGSSWIKCSHTLLSSNETSRVVRPRGGRRRRGRPLPFAAPVPHIPTFRRFICCCRAGRALTMRGGGQGRATISQLPSKNTCRAPAPPSRHRNAINWLSVMCSPARPDFDSAGRGPPRCRIDSVAPRRTCERDGEYSIPPSHSRSRFKQSRNVMTAARPTGGENRVNVATIGAETACVRGGGGALGPRLHPPAAHRFKIVINLNMYTSEVEL